MTYLACTWIVVIATVTMLFQQTYSNTFFYNEKIVHPEANVFREVLDIPPSELIKINYHVAFQAEKCCPYIAFHWVANGWEDWPSRRYARGCAAEEPTFIALYSPFYLSTKVGFPGSGCRAENGYHICEGNRTLSATIPMQWAVITWYHCDNTTLNVTKTLDLTIDLKVQHVTNYMFPCEPLRNAECKERFGYNYTAFPNAFGKLTQTESNLIMAIIQRYEDLFVFKCYPHTWLFICRSLYPTCHVGHKRLLPCQQMCEDFALACREELKKYNMPIYCGHLANSLDPEVCFFEPVRCPQPHQPESGSITTNGTLLGNTTYCICDEGYKIQGDITRHCTHKGLWNSSEPICIPIYNSEGSGKYSPLILSIVPSMLLALLLVIIAIVILCHRMRRKRRMQAKWKLFVTYSSADMDEVSGSFIPKLRRKLSDWDVITYQEDFLPGRPLLDCIKEGVWESDAVLVLLTASFIASSICLFEFMEAQVRSVTDSQFRLVVVLFTKDNLTTHSNLATDFPEELREYVRTRIYLQLGEPRFWTKLKRSLLKKQILITTIA